ncbi:MAG: hypothetical protein IJ446_04560 [Oscillospiraceae bacterium]|nr:hypothetical protein [Oscillospiraceae bacterium]
MCKLFDDWSTEIKDYCIKNGLNFEKAKASSKCWGKNDLILQHYVSTGSKAGLLDETPMPIILMITKTAKGLVFKQTEHTKKYLS